MYRFVSVGGRGGGGRLPQGSTLKVELETGEAEKGLASNLKVEHFEAQKSETSRPTNLVAVDPSAKKFNFLWPPNLTSTKTLSKDPFPNSSQAKG